MLYLNIEKKLGNFILDIELNVGNEAMSLLGASGCGKSMTLKCIAGIEKPDKGRIVLDDRVLFDSEKRINLSPQERRVGLLFQNYGLFPNMTTFQNISMGIRMKDKKEKADKANQIIESFYLTGLENHYPHQLSGGQQQRVALARIMASDPQILMLDEPFSALDSHLKWKLEQEVSGIISRFSGTTLFVSHNRDEIYRICDKAAVMDQGKIESSGDKKEIFQNPKTYSTALLTGCKNISAARCTEPGVIMADDWGLELRIPSECGIKPEELRYVGVRAHSIKGSEEDGGINIFPYELRQEIEDPFNRILMIGKPGGGSLEALRWEFPKNDNGKSEPYPPYIEIPPEAILPLR